MEHKRVHFVIAKEGQGQPEVVRLDCVSAQYRQNRDGRLSPERRERLVEVGFEFQRIKQPCKKTRFIVQLEKKWDELYAKLCAFRQEHGHCHCNVSYNDKNKEALAKWVSKQRVSNRRMLNSGTRQQRLDELNLTWKIR